MNSKSILTYFCFALLYFFSLFSPRAADKLPPEIAGTINPPAGKIAFTRGGNVWTMNADGTKQEMICESINSDGRVSWSPDGEEIAFTRAGQVNLQGPENLGGSHKVYDIFKCYPDSAYANNRQFWYRLTDDVGSRDPEWSRDGSTILFWKDMNSNRVNSPAPNYQLCTMSPDGSDVEILRKDWTTFSDQFLTSPTLSVKGDLAFVYFVEQRQLGLIVVPKARVMASLDSLRGIAEKNKALVAPSWSPDGNWLAVINNNMNDAGLYLVSPDLKKRYVVTPSPVGTYLRTVSPSFSPDGKWLTFSTTDGSIWICDIAGNGLRRLSGPGSDRDPAWSKK